MRESLRFRGVRVALIELSGLRKVYPNGVEAVGGIDLSVDPGDVVPPPEEVD